MTIAIETDSSVAMIGVLVALLLPAIQAAREAANRNATAETWDSEHNNPLIAKMPAVYAKAGREDDGKTVRFRDGVRNTNRDA